MIVKRRKQVTPLHQLGSGLLDVLIAMILIAFTALAVIRYQHQISLTADNAMQETDANILAVNQIESLSYMTTLANYNSIASGTTTNTTAAADTTYTITTTVTSNTNPTYKNVVVNISWTDRGGNARSLAQITNIIWLDPALAAGVM